MDDNDFEVGERVYHNEYGKGTVDSYQSGYTLTFYGSITLNIGVKFDNYLEIKRFDEISVYSLKKLKNMPKDPCECGAKHTSSPKLHMFYCKMFKEVI